MDKKRPNNQKTKRKLEVPLYMQPALVNTKQNKIAFCEEGGLVSNRPPLKGYAKIICNYKGSTKKPIYVFRKKSFLRNDLLVSKKSFVFHAIKGDFIISVSFRGITEDQTGLFTIAVYKVAKPKKKDRTGQNKNLTSLVAFRVISFPTFAQHTKDMLRSSPNGKIIANVYIKDKIKSILSKSRLRFLEKVTFKAIEKMCTTETTYTYYHGCAMVKKMI